MNKAEEMKKITQEVLKEKYPFHQIIYDNILMLIEQKALQGENSIIIYFHNCNSKYLRPYITQLEKDNFEAHCNYVLIDKINMDPYRMALHIHW